MRYVAHEAMATARKPPLDRDRDRDRDPRLPNEGSHSPASGMTKSAFFSSRADNTLETLLRKMTIEILRDRSLAKKKGARGNPR